MSLKNFYLIGLLMFAMGCAKQPSITAESQDMKAGMSASNLALCESERCAMMALGKGTCTFNGQILMDGESVTAYLFKDDPDGTCHSETRVCTNGSLSGGYIYSSCNGAKTSCLFNGQEIPDGGSITAYLNSSGETCESEVRTCTQGVLSGSHSYATCTVNAPNSCLFNGQTIAHDDIAIAYQNSSVPFGETCQEEVRLCQDGNLLGSYQHGSCQVNEPLACSFNGQTYPHGSTITAFQASSVLFGETCVSEERLCNNGNFSGSYAYQSCQVGEPQTCLFNGRNIAHGEVVQAYQNSSVPAGESCVSEARVCTNGSLSGSFNYSSCTPEIPKTCSFNGQTLASGEKINAYLNSSVPFGGECQSEERICEDGALSGSYTYPTCEVGEARSCQFNGQTIAHGQSVEAFQNSNAPYGDSCQSETRTCTDGTLSGSFNYGSCSVDAPSSCLFNGQTIAHGETISAFEQSSVPFGESCKQQVRTCDNGALSGSFEYGSCNVGAPLSCLFNGQTIAHGGSVEAYKEATVQTQERTITSASFSYRDHDDDDRDHHGHGHCCDGHKGHGRGHYSHGNGNGYGHHRGCGSDDHDDDGDDDSGEGALCESETRTCSNGVLSGTYEFASCVAAETPKSCLFNGKTLAHGESVVAYKEKKSCGRDKCLSETRTCLDGDLTGSYSQNSCEHEDEREKKKKEKKKKDKDRDCDKHKHKHKDKDCDRHKKKWWW